MESFLQGIVNFTAGTGIWVYLFIFFGKIIEVAFGTLRIILINRGVRTAGAFIAFIEIVLWLMIASGVLTGFREDILKGVVYAFAFAAGNYVGSWLDELFAFGLCSVQVVISDREHADAVCAAMREKRFGVTELDVHGREGERHYMLITTMKRKRSAEAVELIQSICTNAVITISDIKTQKGGYLHDRVRSGPLRIGK